MDHVWPFIWILVPLIFLDVALKGWGMWRAARMGKTIWFIVLFFVNSLGILPAIFLLFTDEEYTKKNMKNSFMHSDDRPRD